MSESASTVDVHPRVPDQLSKTEQILLAYPGVMVAGAVYPAVIALIVAAHLLCSGNVAEAIGAFVYGCFVFSIVGALATAALGLPFFAVVITFDVAFGKCFHPRTAGIVAGGLTGFVAGGGFYVVYSPIFLISASLAMVLGQWFAACSYDRSFNPKFESRPVNQWWRFEIWRLFTVTAWMAVVLALVRVASAFEPSIAIGTLVWLVLQTITLKLGRQLGSLLRRYQNLRFRVCRD